MQTELCHGSPGFRSKNLRRDTAASGAFSVVFALHQFAGPDRNGVPGLDQLQAAQALSDGDVALAIDDVPLFAKLVPLGCSKMCAALKTFDPFLCQATQYCKVLQRKKHK